MGVWLFVVLREYEGQLYDYRGLRWTSHAGTTLYI